MTERTALLLAATSPPTATRHRVHRAAVAAVYLLVFLLALPWALWALGHRFDRWFDLGPLPARARWVTFAVLAPPGLLLMVRAASALWLEGGGLPISHLPPTRLVSTGIFARLRHPIYVGASLTFAGMGAVSGSLGRAIPSTALLTLAWLAYVVGLEEPTLRRRFGESYERYEATSRRLPWPLTQRSQTAFLGAWLFVRPAAEWLANRTVLFRRKGHVFVTYGLLVAMGAAASTALGSALFASRLADARVDEYLVVLVVSMIVGGRLGWLVYQAPRLARSPRATLRSVGFVSFGSYAATFLVVALWPRWRASETDAWSLLDRTLVPCFLCSAFGRIGCHTYGCCYGKRVDEGLRVRERLAKVVRECGPLGHEPRWPTQLISSAWALFVAVLGFAMLATSAPSGVPAAVSVFVYALGRFGFEALRDEPRALAGRFTRGQLACVALAASALWLLLASPFHFAAAPSAGLSVRWTAILAHGPTIVGVAALVFVICSYHKGEVGRW